MQSKTVVILFSVVSFALGAGLTSLIKSRLASQETNNLPRLTTDPAPVLVQSTPSSPPWGKLEALEIPLGNPDEIVIDRTERLAKRPWFFPGLQAASLDALLKQAGLSAAQWELAHRPGVITTVSDGMTLQPPDELVWQLSEPARRTIYAVLAHDQRNVPQCNPFHFAPNHFESRMAVAELPEEKLARVRNLTYTNYGLLCLADLHMLPGLLTTNELDCFFETLYRLPAYRLRLRITPDADVEALVKYWGCYGRENLIRPIIESITKIPSQTNGASLNLSYFLPPTARTRLYTYPTAWPDSQPTEVDCFWTSLNFFRNPPDERFVNPVEVRRTLATEYEPVRGQPQFGDVVTLMDSTGNGIHACVYLAEDYVFTKNGVSRLQPWVIMKMADMLAGFPSEKPWRMFIYRLKQAPVGSQESEASEARMIAVTAGNTDLDPAPSPSP